MHRPVDLTKEQLYWYELHYRAAQKREVLFQFLSEYPSEPEEAFQNSGRSIFSLETQTRVANQARTLADLWIVARRKAQVRAEEQVVMDADARAVPARPEVPFEAVEEEVAR